MSAGAAGSSGSLHIRPIRPDEGPRLRDIRLRALADTPEAFGQTLEQAQAMSDAEYRTRASAAAAGVDRVFLVAENDEREWVGMVGGLLEHDGRIQLVSMWVSPSVRKQGIGKALIGTLIEWASTRTSARDLYLFVGATNDSAKSLYSSMGFHVTGRTEPLTWNPSITEIEMARPLSRT
jgi:ribosomal protein S18 acetylase RimI-like enzyme